MNNFVINELDECEETDEYISSSYHKLEKLNKKFIKCERKNYKFTEQIRQKRKLNKGKFYD